MTADDYKTILKFLAPFATEILPDIAVKSLANLTV
jgi:hypothetical protein